ncbi:hypothetical protein BU26DRAFT_138072 [Trematosphaeria pertusa]|uniref:Uncharacterized protein n=1 Tax=Trematosphaeria pertusa TaxID=390896 RepID=A0A6A6IVJ7_9PLEO|nr:uncharacterized protein BU26DRAFT_138072 [Trematosphaeria pertusa]KAF2254444.1 hypothetical protein BU26DRAFT_138072 [Trematosphaeria pertusa]
MLSCMIGVCVAVGLSLACGCPDKSVLAVYADQRTLVCTERGRRLKMDRSDTEEFEACLWLWKKGIVRQYESLYRPHRSR